MPRASSVIAVALVIIGGAVAVLFFYHSKPKPGTARIARLQERDRVAAFIARFDSLTDVRLYPVVWRSGTFVTTAFDDSRTEWTLTVSPADWGRRDETSKKDLAATLFSTFQGVRAQAGGDPDQAVLVIESKEGEVFLRVSKQTGITVHQ
jgi:hypothetical protein